jgi:hypothetical protein
MAITRHRFIVLFAALLLFYICAPILQELRQREFGGTAIFEPLLFVALLTGTVLSVSQARWGNWIGLGLAVPTALLSMADVWVESTPSLWMIRQVLTGTFLVYTIGVVLRYVFHRRHVTYDTVCASLCVYLLFGLVWALMYEVADKLNPAAFQFSAERGSPMTGFGRGETNLLYFSFVTLTTLGYGDIVPTSPITRMLAGLEAITGQLYLVVMVSRLVGLEIAESLERRNTQPAPSEDDES